MPIQIKELNNGVIHVEWKTKVKNLSGDFGRDFKLERFHPKINYSVQCDLMSRRVRGNDSSYKVRLVLSWISPSTCPTNNIHHQPRTIWVSFNQSNQFELRKEPMISRQSKLKWISTKMIVNLDPILQKVEKQLLTLSLWFEFETLTVGQHNTLNSITGYLYVDQTKCDVQFCFNGGQKIGGHRNILSARSAVFEAMFRHDMKENNTGQVDIQDIELIIFDQLLYYIYSGRLCTSLSVENAQALFVAANKYEIWDLKEECFDFLMSSFQVENAINLMAWAHVHSVDEMKEAVLAFAAQHGKEICQLEEWLHLTKNYPELSVLATRRMMK